MRYLLIVLALMMTIPIAYGQDASIKKKKVKTKFSQKPKKWKEIYYVRKKDRSVKEGEYTKFYPGKKVKEQGMYVNNQKVGVWKTYLEDGKLECEAIYAAGVKDGLCTCYHSNGKKSIVTNYKGDSKDGEEVRFDEAGKELKTVKYTMGKVVVPYSMPESFNVAEEMPQFPGGENALNNYITTKKIYPLVAKENREEGKVFLSFIVGKDGIVKNASVDRNPLNAKSKVFHQEALRIVEAMPKWEPAYKNGKAVEVKQQIVITFELD